MKHLIIIIIILLNFFSNSTGFCQREITVDFENEIATIKNLLGVNREPGNKMLGYKEAGVTAVRMHDDRVNDYQYYSDFWNYDPASDSFSSINTDFDPTDPSQYHWDEFDKKVNAIVENEMDVYFRIGISWPSNPNFATPPLTAPLDPDGVHFTNFAELCKRTVMHCNEGWDNGYHSNIQYWEIWNEPGGIFWKGSIIQFYRMYEAVSQTLKSYDPNLKVGGLGAVPSTIVRPKDEYFKNFLQYMSDNNVPLDFYSWHLYGAKNPYGVKYWAEIVRQQLDVLGFTNAESHISEINYELGEAQKLLEDNAAGTAYLLSNLLTAQESPVDKMFWYPGLALFNDDDQNTPQFKCNAYALKTFSLIFENTPIQIRTTGSHVVESNWQADTTNFMVLAAKSENDNKIYLAISNYKSDYQNYEISIHNLPWLAADQIKITKNIVIGPSDKFTETTTYQSGGNTMNISVNDMPSPSITLMRLEKEAGSGVKNKNNAPENFHLYQNYPNPFNSSTAISYQLSAVNHVKLTIYDVLGKKIRTLINNNETAGEHSVGWDGKDDLGNPVSSGVYFYKLKLNDNFVQIKKLTFVK